MERASGAVSHAREAVAERATHAREAMGERAGESPLLLAGALLGLGVLIGLAIPTSRREDELLGPVRDDLLEQARRRGRDVVHKVQRVAGAASAEAMDRALSAEGDVGQRVISAAEGALAAARREAEGEGPSGGGGDGRQPHRSGAMGTPGERTADESGGGGGLPRPGAGAEAASPLRTTIAGGRDGTPGRSIGTSRPPAGQGPPRR